MGTITSDNAQRRKMIAEDGAGWAVLDYEGVALPGRWATEADATHHGYAGMYLLSGDAVRYVTG